MTAHSRLVRKIREKWEAERARRPGTSLRGFAHRLGMSPGAFSQILSGKRPVTPKSAQRLSRALGVPAAEAGEWLDLARKARAYSPSAKAVVLQYAQIGDDQFRAIADWHCFAILSLLETKDFQPSAAWIAGRFGIGVATAERSIERLERLGLLVRKPDGSLSRGAPRYETSDEAVSLPVRSAHAESLELARQSLFRDGLERRDFSSMTFAINPSAIPKAKELIRRFQDELSELFEADDEPTEVYRLGMQLFPLTRLERGVDETGGKR